MSNSLLDKVVYVSRTETKMLDLKNDNISVFPTFAYDPASPNTAFTAHQWAACAHKSQDDMRQDIEKDVAHDNTPFKIKIISLDVRTQGGRAYKVIDAENRLFDLRESQLLEAINLNGIQAGGNICGEFVWGKAGSQMTLTLVGGALHAEMMAMSEAKKKHKEKCIEGAAFSPAKCKAGHVYERFGRYYLFVGRLKQTGVKKDRYVLAELNDANREPHWLYSYDYETKQYIKRTDVLWNTVTWNERVTATLKYSSLDYSVVQSFASFSEELECVSEETLNSARAIENLARYLETPNFALPYPNKNHAYYYGYNSEAYKKQEAIYKQQFDNWTNQRLLFLSQNTSWTK